MKIFSRKKQTVRARVSATLATGLAILGSTSLLAPAHAYSYTITHLGMAGIDINNSDWVTGNGANTLFPYASGSMWTWDPVGGAIERGLIANISTAPYPLPGAGGTAIANTYPYRIAGAGVAPGPNSQTACYWTPNVSAPTGYTPTNLAPDFQTTGHAGAVFGADDYDGVAGSVDYFPMGTSLHEACWWLLPPTNTSTPTPIKIYPGIDSNAFGINGYGAGFHNVVGSYKSSSSPVTYRAFLAVVNNSGSLSTNDIFPLDALTVPSEAKAINATGTVVGVRNGHAFVFVPSTANGTTGTVTYLSETPSGGSAGSSSYAYDINASGTIVGYFINSSGTRRAARWDAPYTGNVIDLNSLASLGTNNTARAINSSGNIVVGGSVAYASDLLTYHP